MAESKGRNAIAILGSVVIAGGGLLVYRLVRSKPVEERAAATDGEKRSPSIVRLPNIPSVPGTSPEPAPTPAPAPTPRPEPLTEAPKYEVDKRDVADRMKNLEKKRVATDLREFTSKYTRVHAIGVACNKVPCSILLEAENRNELGFFLAELHEQYGGHIAAVDFHGRDKTKDGVPHITAVLKLGPAIKRDKPPVVPETLDRHSRRGAAQGRRGAGGSAGASGSVPSAGTSP